MAKVTKRQQVLYRFPWPFWQPIKRSKRSFISMFDPWSLMDVYPYVEEVTMVSAHSSRLDLSRYPTTYSGSCGHQRDTTPVCSGEYHPLHEFINVPTIS